MTTLLLDTYNLLFRSFTSLPAAITAGDGLPINAVYGMLAFVIRLTREYGPSHAVAAFDVPEVPTFRHRLYPAYQGHRGPLGGDQADEFRRQVLIAQGILPQIGIPALQAPGHEADDIMGTLATRLAMSGRQSLLVSTDRDLLQLARPGIEILVPGKEVLRINDEAGVRARIGVAPAGVTMFKALAGDASDNIPGLPGIGTKTAVRLVDEYGTLGELYGRLDELQPRLSRILAAGKEEAYLFQQVATIVTDLTVGIEPEDLPPLAVSPDDRPRQILDRCGYGAQDTKEPGG